MSNSTPSAQQAPARYFEITQKFFFDAAHTLKRATATGPVEAESSRRIHGHTYHAEVTLAGLPDAATGMVVDLGLVRMAIAELRPQLDHHLLDEVPGLGPATLENLSAFIWQVMDARLPQLTQVRVWREALGDGCTLRRSPRL